MPCWSLLLCTMATPRYKSKAVYALAIALILSINISANYYFYRTQNYTAVFYVDLAMLLVIGVALKPVHRHDQAMVLQLRHHNQHLLRRGISELFHEISSPIPCTAIQSHVFLLFTAFILAFKEWVSAPYRKVLDYWHIHLLPIVALLACLLGYFFGGDICDTLDLGINCLYSFSSSWGFAVYTSIIYSLKNHHPAACHA